MKLQCNGSILQNSHQSLCLNKSFRTGPSVRTTDPGLSNLSSQCAFQYCTVLALTPVGTSASRTMTESGLESDRPSNEQVFIAKRSFRQEHNCFSARSQLTLGFSRLQIVERNCFPCNICSMRQMISNELILGSCVNFPSGSQMQ